MDQYQETLNEWREWAGIPVVAGTIRIDGSLVWHGASQAVNVEEIGVISPQSRFPIYSVTKSLTAVCTLQLAQARGLQLNDHVGKWMDNLPEYSAVSLQQLLQHTGGLADYGHLDAYNQGVRATPSNPWSDEKFFKMALVNGPLFKPGTGWSYSNVGYLILRRVIEHVAGTTFCNYVDRQIVSRLRLRDTFIAESIEDWATCVPGYGSEVREDAKIVDVLNTYHPGWCAPGVAVSTVDEVTRFYDGLFSGELLENEYLELMLRMVRVGGSHPPAVTPSSGLGILGDPDGVYGPSYGHGGAGPGFVTEASILPYSRRGRIAVALFCNNSPPVAIKFGAQSLLRVATDAP